MYGTELALSPATMMSSMRISLGVVTDAAANVTASAP
jgi:hypothetical protein